MCIRDSLIVSLSANHRAHAQRTQGIDGPGGPPLTLWESGAILWYLAEKTGKFLPDGGSERHLAHQWLMFQMAGVGPMFGQFAHFFFYAKEKHLYSIER